MKVLLKKDVDTLGYAGEIFDVSAGYGRNYLIPRGLAVPATEGALKQAEKWIEQAAARRDELRQEYARLVDRLNGHVIKFYSKAGERGRLYGSVTTAEITDKLNEEIGLNVDRRKVSVAGKAIRQIGAHPVTVRFDSDHIATIRVQVLSEDDEGQETVAEEDAVVEVIETDLAVEDAEVLEEATE